MRIAMIHEHYPTAARVIRRQVDEGRAFVADAEGLSHFALERIERGDTTERDLIRLLAALADRRRRGAAEAQR